VPGGRVRVALPSPSTSWLAGKAREGDRSALLTTLAVMGFPVYLKGGHPVIIPPYAKVAT